MTPQIIHFDSLPSTNSEAARQALAGAAEGLCIVAAEQTAGRGRLERRWVSPKNAGLYCSVLLRPAFEQSGWTLVPLMAAIAVHEALQRACDVVGDIKWPNDILIAGKKVCGILAETVETPSGRALVLGIGINLNNDAFPAELATATSIEAETGTKPNSELILHELLGGITRHYAQLSDAGGKNEIVSEWCARSSYCNNKHVRVTEGCKSFTGTTRGIEPDGALRVETETGEMRIVRAADVSTLRSQD